MAASMSSYRIAAAAIPQQSKPDANRKSNNWWAPILGWSSEPDYITNWSSDQAVEISAEKSHLRGCFTERKAKELRKKTAETTTFHDIMYHSAIASRLASDLSGSHEV